MAVKAAKNGKPAPESGEGLTAGLTRGDAPAVFTRPRAKQKSDSNGILGALSRYYGGTAGGLGNFLTPLRVRMEQANGIQDPFIDHAWARAAIHVQAEALAGAPFRIFTGDREDPQEIEDQGTDPGAARGRGSAGQAWARLFANPNPMMTPGEFWYMADVQKLVTGETDWLLWSNQDNGRPVNENEMPDEIYPIPATLATHYTSPTTHLIEAWKISLDTAQIDAPAHAVLQFKCPHWGNPYRGVSPLHAVGLEMAQDHSEDVFTEAYYNNACDAGGWLVNKDGEIDTPQLEALRMKYEARHKGQENAGRIGWLSGDWTMIPRTINNQQTQMMEMKAWRRASIFAVLNVTEYDVGLVENVNRATAAEAERRLYSKNVMPKAKGYDDGLWAWMRGFDGGAFWGVHTFDHVEELGEDSESRRQAAREDYKAGLATRNEVNARYELGYEEDTEFGDTRLVPMGYEPVEVVADPLAGVDPFDDDDEDSPSDDAAPEPDPPESDADEKSGSLHSPLRAPGVPRSREDGDRIWRLHLKAVFNPFERQYRTMIRRHFVTLRNETLRNLDDWLSPSADNPVADAFFGETRQEILGAADVISILFSKIKADARLRRLSARIYRAIGKRERALLENELGGLEAFLEGSPEVESFLDLKTNRVTRINDTVRRRISQTIIEGIAANETVTEIRSRINAEFKFSTKRSLTIARTEVAQAANGVRHVGMELEGVQTHEWSTAGDEHVRETHVQENGNIVTVGTPFPVTGLLHPGDVNGPARETINCRCVSLAAD